jgi:RNA polymerase sigma-54 factor
VDDKWVQTPRGIFPLKRFFGGGKKVGDEEIAWEVMKQKLLEIIDQEDKTNPLSDEELVERAKSSPRVRAHLDGKQIRQTIVVPRKLVNLVIA